MKIMEKIAMIAVTGLAVALIAGCGEEDDGFNCGDIIGTPRVMEEAKLYFEYQSTDNDTGIHGLMGGVDWAEMCITAPDGTTFLVARPQGDLAGFGLSDLFFESREPAASVMSQAEILAMFPAGDWDIVGRTWDGASFVGTAWLTHNLPRPPVITAPADNSTVDPSNVVVTWEPVSDTVDGDPVTITGYEIIVTNDDADGDDPHGMSHPILSAHLVPSATMLTIPEEFFEPATLYELEVIAIEESGNQTITVFFFDTP